MSAAMPWIKLYTEMLDDPKIGKLPDAMKWRFVQLVLLAGECDAEGCIANGDVALTVDEVAWRLRLNAEQLATDIAALKKISLMSDDDGTICVVNFTKRQGRPQGERQQRWRENQKHKRAADKEAKYEPDNTPKNDVTDERTHVIDDTTMTRRPRVEESREEKSAAVAAPKSRTMKTSTAEQPTRERDPFFDKLAELTQTNPKLQGALIGKTKRDLLGVDATLEQVSHFAEWWRCVDWRGKQKQPPTLPQVVSEWEKAMLWQAIPDTSGTDDKFTTPNGKVVNRAS